MDRKALRDGYLDKQNRDKYLHNAGEKRQLLYTFINSYFFVQGLLTIIFISTIGVFLLTFERLSIRYAFPIMIMDSCIMAIFIVEACFKMIIFQADYFREVWNLLDVLIIVVHFTDVLVDLITNILALSADLNANIYFKFLKSLRALRLLRVIKFLPNLQVILTTVFQSILSLGSIAILMSLFIFVFAVMGRGLFNEDSPDHFGTIWLAFVTLFQLLTLDDWFELLDSVDQNEKFAQYWIMFFYLFCYIAIEYFIFLNLFVAVLVDNFQLTLAGAELKKKKEALVYLEGDETLEDIFNQELKEQREKLKTEENGNTDAPEMHAEDYYSYPKGSRTAEFLENILKDLASIDFQKYLWKRRYTMMNNVVDQAIKHRYHNWRVQDYDPTAVSKLGHIRVDNKKKLDKTQ